jgi:hypothetical protein
MKNPVVLWIDPYSKAVSEEWTQGARKLIVPRLTYARANERARRLLGMPLVQRWCDHG